MHLIILSRIKLRKSKLYMYNNLFFYSISRTVVARIRRPMLNDYQTSGNARLVNGIDPSVMFLSNKTHELRYCSNVA